MSFKLGLAPSSKYGLIKKNVPVAAKRTTLKASALGFEEELDDVDADNNNSGCQKDNQRSEIHKVNASLVHKSNATAKEIDALNNRDVDIYDYDGFLEQKEGEQQNRKEEQALSRGVRGVFATAAGNPTPAATYVHSLKSAAVIREKEKDRQFERKLQKERKAEEDKEREETGTVNEMKFVTSAYKQKLIEQTKWEEEDKIMREVEKRTTVGGASNAAGMSGFYTNLLTKNIAMGGNLEESALSAYTSGSKRQSSLLLNSNSDSSIKEEQGRNKNKDAGGVDDADKRATEQQPAGHNHNQHQHMISSNSVSSVTTPTITSRADAFAAEDGVDMPGAVVEEKVEKEVVTAAAVAVVAEEEEARKQAMIESARARYFKRARAR